MQSTTYALSTIIDDIQTRDRARLIAHFTELAKECQADNSKWQKLIADADRSKENGSSPVSAVGYNPYAA